jgi:transposase
MAKQKNEEMRRRKPVVSALPVLRSNVAGIDIGSREHWVAGPQADDGKTNVRVFSSTTNGLNGVADWLVSQGVASVAMESTSVYWIPLYELLESRGLEVLLVNARQLHNVPGRKTDMHDCQWLQVLHSCGLLRGSFRPPEEIVRVRALHRQMMNLVAERTRAVQWMQKALDQMNVQVHRAVTDLTGMTGLAIVRAIVEGERDPFKLATHRDPRCHKSEAEIAAYLKGTWRDEHVFNLGSALRLFDTFEAEIARYNAQIDDELKRLETLDRGDEGPPPNPSSAKEKTIIREGSGPRRDTLFRAAGVNLTRIDGIGVDAATTIIDELGTSLQAFPTESHFISWLKLCPHTPTSAGKPLNKKKRGLGANRVSNVLRMAATSLARSKSAVGAYYRRIARHKDGATAVFATARKLASYVYRLLRHGQPYVDIGAHAYEEAAAQRRLNALNASAKALGYSLVPLQATSVVAG